MEKKKKKQEQIANAGGNTAKATLVVLIIVFLFMSGILIVSRTICGVMFESLEKINEKVVKETVPIDRDTVKLVGNYTVSLPEGWTSELRDGNAIIVSPDGKVTGTIRESDVNMLRFLADKDEYIKKIRSAGIHILKQRDLFVNQLRMYEVIGTYKDKVVSVYIEMYKQGETSLVVSWTYGDGTAYDTYHTTTKAITRALNFD